MRVKRGGVFVKNHCWTQWAKMIHTFAKIPLSRMCRCLPISGRNVVGDSIPQYVAHCIVKSAIFAIFLQDHGQFHLPIDLIGATRWNGYWQSRMLNALSRFKKGKDGVIGGWKVALDRVFVVIESRANDQWGSDRCQQMIDVLQEYCLSGRCQTVWTKNISFDRCATGVRFVLVKR